MFLGISVSLDRSPPCTILQMNFSCACFSISIKHDVDNPMRSSATCRYIYTRPRPPNENKFLGRDINHARFKRLRSIGHSGMFDICVPPSAVPPSLHGQKSRTLRTFRTFSHRMYRIHSVRSWYGMGWVGFWLLDVRTVPGSLARIHPQFLFTLSRSAVVIAVQGCED